MDRKITTNYIYNLIYQAVNVVIPLITTPYVARVLKADGVGIFSYTNAVAMGFALFAALGINNYAQREIAYCGDKVKERSILFWEFLLFRVILVVVVSVLFIVYSYSVPEYSLFLLIQIPTILAVATDISWLFKGVENFKIIAIRNIFIKLILTVLIFLFVRTKDDLLLYMLLHSMASFLGNLIFWISIDGVVKKVKINEIKVLAIIRGSIEFFIPLIAVQIYSQLDRIMLGSLTGDPFESGYYEQSRKIVNIAVTLLVSINTVLMPRISNLYAKHDYGSVKQIYNKAYKYIVFTIFPVVIGLFFASDNFTRWFLGSGYEKVSLLLKISIPLIVFMVLGNYIGNQFLIPTGKQNVMTFIYVIAALCNVILNTVLIPRLYSIGALMASCIAELVAFAGQLLLLQNSEFKIDMLSGIWKYFFSAAVSALCLLVLDWFSEIDGLLYSLLQMIVCLGTYLFMLLILDGNMRHLLMLKIKK